VRPSTSCEQRPSPSAVYIPTHAARDFSRLSLVPRIHPHNPHVSQYAQDWVYSDEQATIQPTPYDSLADESTDFQDFLEASQQASIRIESPQGNGTLPQRDAYVLNDITASQKNLTHERHISISPSKSKRTASRGRGRQPTFVEKVSEYIKPSRSSSSLVYNPQTGFATLFADENSHERGSVAEGQARWDERWSKVRGSFTRSFSRNRDDVDDEEIARWRTTQTEDEKAKHRIAPISTGFYGYDHAVEHYYLV